MSKYDAKMVERFAKFVGEPDANGCRNWQGCLNAKGYGIFCISVTNTAARAHRIAYELAHGPIPRGMLVRHKCDNRGCVEETHLEIGTAVDNTHDMMVRGRHRTCKGEANKSSKLTAQQVLAIRADTRQQRTIAAEHGISFQLVSFIRARKRWSHV